MVVTWLTTNLTQTSVVEYGSTNVMEMKAVGVSTKFVDGGDEHREMYIHRATMSTEPGKSYCKK